MKMFSPQDIFSIFASRPGWFVPDKQALSDIKFLLEHDYLHLVKDIFCAKEKFFNTLDKLESNEISVFDFDGGKMEHIALKALVRDWYHDKKNFYVEVK